MLQSLLLGSSDEEALPQKKEKTSDFCFCFHAKYPAFHSEIISMLKKRTSFSASNPRSASVPSARS